MTALHDYLEQLDDLPADVLLGRIVLFTITDEKVKRSDMEQWFIDLGLDTAYLPNENKPSDSYKKATSDVKEVYEMSKNRTGLLLCRDVTTTVDMIHRQITREIRDAANKRLSYERVVDCVFYKGNNNLVIKPLLNMVEAGEQQIIQQVAQDIHARFWDYYEHMDSQKLRGTVRGYLKKLNAIEIKGGVYFIHSSKDKELSALAELVSRFGGGCHMNTIPIVDLERERQFLARVFEREASESLASITRDIRDLKSSRKSVSPAAYAKMKARYDAVLANAEEHMLTLQVSQNVTAASAEVALNALLDLEKELTKT